MAGDRGGSRLDAPGEADGLRRVVNRAVSALRRLSGQTIEHVDLLAERVTLGVVALDRPVGDTELSAGLLTKVNSCLGSLGTVTGHELVGERVGLDGTLEGLSGLEGEVFDVVRVDIGDVGPGRGLGDLGETVPGYALAILAGARVHDVQSAVVNTSLVDASAILVPGESSHAASS